MADVLAIVPQGLVDGFHLAGARAWGAASNETARDLLLAALADPDAGIVALAESYFSALDPRTRRMVEQRARPLVVALPLGGVEVGTTHRAYLVELIRRAVGVKVFLEAGKP